jgi:excisionase family DNA binding protein
MEAVLLRIQETARLLKVSKWTVYRWIHEGRLEATKIGQGSLRVFQASVRELIRQARVHDCKTRTLSKSARRHKKSKGRR